MSDEAPPLAPAPESLTLHFRPNASTDASVTVDRSSGMIHFDNCFSTYERPYVIFAEFRCPLDELFDFYRPGRGTVAILTQQGKAKICLQDAPRSERRLQEFVEFLVESAPPARRRSELRKPSMVIVSIGAILAGMIAGGYLTPTGEEGHLRYRNMVIMAGLTLALSESIVLIAQRRFGLRLAVPMEMGVLGSSFGIVPYLVMSLRGRPMSPLGGLASFGVAFLVGTAVGFWLQSRSDVRQETFWAEQKRRVYSVRDQGSIT